ncbi:DUF4190 domain-containing protein [Nocardia blacklockiae]|uniref:DUF4190 domain-containing protein n=1 Tax=Nocardia blacklockiae TaxID=480036 RepID=UPI001895EB37|nr:DUF4190 domain-containing protein [Nocardia blacklockiae]MBF6175469.1 DUF4190 domain-containing protein [Nocardia blacklockiae]
MSYPPPPPQFGGYGYPPYQPPEHPQATTVLILGIVSLLCGLVGPFAWVMGRRTLTEIDNSGGMYGGRTNAQVGYVLGIVSTVLVLFSLLLIVGYIVLVVVFAIGASST